VRQWEAVGGCSGEVAIGLNQPGRKVFLAEVAASAKGLRQEQGWHVVGI
jgi:hypothetical protein